jgi:hypothetical protein
MDYTPAPWKARAIDYIASEPASWEIRDQYGVIATVESVNADDAALIAAAPDLLAACIEATSLFDNYPECYEAIGTLEVLIQAINKATQQ